SSNELRNYTWNQLDVKQWPDHDPLNAIIDRFVPNWAEWRDRSLIEFTGELDGLGQVVEIRNLSEDRWPEWKSFLLAYSHALSNVPITSRWLLFCVVPPCCGPLPGNDVCLQVMPWCNTVGRLDWLHLAEIRVSDLLSPPACFLERQLAAAAIAAVGCGDPLLIASLISAGWETWVDGNRLVEFCRDVGGSCSRAFGTTNWDLWRNGYADKVDGVWIVSSRWLARHGS